MKRSVSLLVAILVLVPTSVPSRTPTGASGIATDSLGSALRDARVLSVQTLPPASAWSTIAERIYRESLSRVFGDRLEYDYERLDVSSFPDPSIVFHGLLDERPVPRSTGYNFEFQFKKSLDLALRVHPRTRRATTLDDGRPEAGAARG